MTGAGWLGGLRISLGEKTAEIRLSYAYDPFPELLDWLQAVATGDFPEEFEICGEGPLKTLVVENGNWGATSLRAIHGVVESAYAVLVEAFEKEPEDIIHLIRWNQKHHLVVHNKRPYKMYLSAWDKYWSQYVYQFSHDLCHILTNFDRVRKHRHKWFEGSLCELSSLFVLHRLAETWAESPPAGVFEAADFAPNHREYAEYIGAEYGISSGEDISRWLSENIRTLETSSAERELNGAVAVALLDRFREDPSLWRECGWLNHWNPEGGETFPDYLDS